MRQGWVLIACLCVALSEAAAFPFVPKELTRGTESVPTVFEVGDLKIGAELVTLEVPEVRADRQSRTIAVRFVRLPARNPQGLPPVVYLAGGPGGSATGTAKFRRWALFDALQEVTDVILLDQRGTGISDRGPECRSSIGFSSSQVIDREVMADRYRMAFSECEAYWEAAGFDLQGYNTLESADDIAAVAEFVGGRVSLLGISYGTHLALAAMKAHPDKIDRAILVGTEGLDQTVKMPAHVDAYFDRLQVAIDTQDEAQAFYPDIKALFARVLGELEKEPREINVYLPGGRQAQRMLSDYPARAAISFAVSDPRRVPSLLEGFRAADEQDDWSFFARMGYLLPDHITLEPMSTAMDIASGGTKRRLRKVEQQSVTAITRDAHNFPMPHLVPVGRHLRLPDSFRKRPNVRTPILLFSGTLDGRTFPEAGLKATREMKKNRTVVTVKNGGHNLFFDHPSIVPLMVAYLQGKEVEDQTLIAELPDFASAAND